MPGPTGAVVRGTPPIRSHRGPRQRRSAKRHGDRSYIYDHLRQWPCSRNSTPHITRKDIEPPKSSHNLLGTSYCTISMP